MRTTTANVASGGAAKFGLGAVLSKYRKMIKRIFSSSELSAIPALSGKEQEAQSVNRSITGIIRSDGTVEAYVQDASYSYTHKGLGLTEDDLGFNLFYYDGKWQVTGSGYSSAQGWAIPNSSQIESIKTIFGVK